jgi:threonine/homoserine/homoserine lactone efflux protein
MSSPVWAFVGAALIIQATPGPMVLFIVTRSIDQGLRSGLGAVLGISTATVVHVAVVSVGIASVLLSSPAVFRGLKYAGAAYLMVLGIRMLVSARALTTKVDESNQLTGSSFRDGFLVNLLNPNTPIFLLALLPQFLDSEHATSTQLMTLGVAFAALGAANDSLWAFAAGALGDWLRRHTNATVRFDQVTGLTLIALGVTTGLKR